MDFYKNRMVFKKELADYFVLLNVDYNALFIFNAATELLWDAIDAKGECFESLQEKLVKKGYDVRCKDLKEIIAMLKKIILIIDIFQLL